MARRRKKKIPYVYQSPEHEKGYKRIENVVGPNVLKRVREDLGKKQVDDVAKALGKKLTDKEVRSVEKLRGRRRQLPLSEIDKERHREIQKIRERKPPVRFIRLRDGSYHKQNLLTGKKVKVTAKAKKQYESSFAYQRYVGAITHTLPISAQKARSILKAVRDDAVAKLERFKKTKKFKSMSKKKRRRYTKARTRRWATVRLMKLLDEQYGRAPETIVDELMPSKKRKKKK